MDASAILWLITALMWIYLFVHQFINVRRDKVYYIFIMPVCTDVTVCICEESGVRGFKLVSTGCEEFELAHVLSSLQGALELWRTCRFDYGFICIVAPVFRLQPPGSGFSREIWQQSTNIFLCSGGWKPQSYSFWPVDSPSAVRPWGHAPNYSTARAGGIKGRYLACRSWVTGTTFRILI